MLCREHSGKVSKQFIVTINFWASVLHCASLLRTIFVSFARAHERVHQHHIKDFPQAIQLDSKNAGFFLNKQVDLYFYCIIVVYLLFYSLILKNN